MLPLLLSLSLPGIARRASPADAPTITVDLVDGSRLIGTPQLAAVPVTTPYARMDIPLDQLVSLTLHSDHTTASLVLKNGDRIEGQVDLAPLRLSTLFGEATINLAHIARIEPWRVPVSPEGLVLHYTFDVEQDGLVPDSSPQANHGRLLGPQRIADGLSGSAYRFDGQDDRIDCGASPSLQITGALTYSAWFRASSAHTGALVSRRRSGDTANDIASHLTLRDTGGMTAGIVGPVFAPGRGAHAAPDSDLDDGEWHHAAMIYRPGEALVLMVDGSVAAENDEGIFPSLSARALPVMVGASNTKYHFHGDIDEVMVFSRALSEAEVRALHSAHRALPQDGSLPGG